MTVISVILLTVLLTSFMPIATVDGNIVAIMQSMAPAILPYVSPMLKGLQDMVNNNHHTNTALNADQDNAKMAEYAKEFYETMEKKCDKDNDAMELENVYLKFAVGALSVVLLVFITVSGYSIHYLSKKAAGERPHSRDMMMAMRDKA